MKTRFILAIATALLFSAGLFADDPVRRTIVVKDGKVLKDGKVFQLDGELLGFSRAWLGVSLLDVTPGLREHFGAPRDAGVLVSEVAPDSPAAKAGLRAGDVILSIDGAEIDSAWDLRRGLRDKKSGDGARLEILRDKARHTLVATVTERDVTERLIGPMHLEELSKTLGEKFSGPEWRARVESLGDCGNLQNRIRDLETRLKDLEKKLQR